MSPLRSAGSPPLAPQPLTRQAARKLDDYMSLGRDTVSRWWATRSRGAVILGYHRVADVTSDPWKLAVSPAVFGEHLAMLRSSFRPVPVDDLIRAAGRRRLPPRAVGVTFDDGYADNLHAAAPALRDMGVPATVFVSTVGIDGGAAWWWHELEVRLLGLGPVPRQLEVTVGRRRQRWSTVTAEERRRCHDDLQRSLRRGDPPAIDGILSQLRQWGEPSHASCAGLPRSLTVAELVQLPSFGVAVGAHGHHHIGLRAQSATTIQYEVRRSRELLADWLGAFPAGFSYPYGDAGRPARRAVVSEGCEWAVGVRAAPVTSLSNRYELPRLMVGHEDAGELERKVACLLRGRRDHPDGHGRRR